MLSCQKDLFQIANEVTYLNCAYMSPQSLAVEKAGIEALKRKGQPYLISPNHFFEAVQKLTSTFAHLIGAKDPNRIAIIPSVSYGIANVANNAQLAPGDKIVVVEEQFPSNIYSWHKLAEKKGAEVIEVKSPEGTEERGKRWNQQLMEAIDSKTKIVALPHVHWADGTLYDLKAIREAATSVGAWLVIDGTQSVGALPFNVAEIKPDALICAGYKWLMGPYSMGLAYYGEVLDQGEPLEENWINRFNSEDFSGLVQYESRYQPMAKRYSVGEQSNFILVPMLQAALEMIAGWGISAIQEYCKEIGEDALKQLKELGFWAEEETYRSSHLIGIRTPNGLSLENLTQKLKERDIHVSVRGNAIRISPHVYNTKADFEKLVECCKEVL